ncbi:hypothetical protein AS594_07125 [Streptomyces agglomeratus]|uniref:Uncharacterized protein n=1 Tax=Streptomyces agglomeratus TaxID=285458 RepID=A0A1E5P4M7_9ACTN|nr:hypothetical protein [Streptomyces agglomeratus]OEJ24294.1 hypothetical protein AS594_07125 [Streptomyces agglomeratus]
MTGERCTSGCRTKDHDSYGACLQSKGVKTYLASPSKGLDGTAQKKWDAELSAYANARKQGIQPDGTTMQKVTAAIKASDKVGAAYGRDFNVAGPMKGA